MTTSDTTTGGADAPDVDEVAYPSGGPSGPVIPAGTEAYELLATGRCSELLAAIDASWGDPGTDDPDAVDPVLVYLYRSAARACLADWSGAASDFDHVDPADLPGDGDCPEDPETGTCERCYRIVFEWVAALLQRRESDPSFSPRFVPSRGADPCPSIEDTTTTSAPETTTTSADEQTTTTGAGSSSTTVDSTDGSTTTSTVTETTGTTDVP